MDGAWRQGVEQEQEQVQQGGAGQGRAEQPELAVNK